jgi:hypothetical protein
MFSYALKLEVGSFVWGRAEGRNSVGSDVEVEVDVGVDVELDVDASFKLQGARSQAAADCVSDGGICM